MRIRIAGLFRRVVLFALLAAVAFAVGGVGCRPRQLLAITDLVMHRLDTSDDLGSARVFFRSSRSGCQCTSSACFSD